MEISGLPAFMMPAGLIAAAILKKTGVPAWPEIIPDIITATVMILAAAWLSLIYMLVSADVLWSDRKAGGETDGKKS